MNYSKNELLPKLIKYDARIDTKAPNQSSMGLSIIRDNLKFLVYLFEIIRTHLFPQVSVEGCGIYDNIGHGVQTEGDTAIMNTDILCNQRHAVSAEGTANIQVRIY